MEYLITNAKLIDAFGETRGSVLVRGGKIAAVGDVPGFSGEIIDAGGLTLMPAFCDLHVHFRDPGLTYKEDIATGSAAAAKGGFTAVNTMANTQPVASSMDTVRYVQKKSEEIGLVKVHQAVSVSKDFDGQTLTHLDELDDTVKCISEDGKGVMNNHVFLAALKKAKEKGWVVLSHAEDMDISPYDYRLAENIATAQHILLAQAAGARLHLCHVSTKEAMKMVVAAKEKGENISCEVAPHHLWFCDNPYRVNPPIRQKEDRDFLIRAALDGKIDAIATDHAPHSAEDKAAGSPGMIGLETAFAVCYTKLVKEHGMPLAGLSRMMAARPAEILGLNQGRLLPGYDADLVLVDESRVWTVKEEDFASKSKNSPFVGETLCGKVVWTIKDGKTTYCEKEE